jgi:hypothetical protein
MFIPFGMLGAEVTQKHLAGAGVHIAGDMQALGAGFGADNPGHVVVDHFDGRGQCAFGRFHGITVPVLSEL